MSKLEIRNMSHSPTRFLTMLLAIIGLLASARSGPPPQVTQQTVVRDSTPVDSSQRNRRDDCP
jgi:hypothetical protein